MKKLALVLGGGAAKGYAHIGVLKVLEKNGYSVHSGSPQIISESQGNSSKYTHPGLPRFIPSKSSGNSLGL